MLQYMQHSISFLNLGFTVARKQPAAPIVNSIAAKSRMMAVMQDLSINKPPGLHLSCLLSQEKGCCVTMQLIAHRVTCTLHSDGMQEKGLIYQSFTGTHWHSCSMSQGGHKEVVCSRDVAFAMNAG